MYTFVATDESDTQRLGAALARVLPPGSVVALIGPLGAGKTRLVQSVAEALGVPGRTVTSPTFVLVNEYSEGRLPIFHFDTYRLKDDDEFLALGADEYFDAGGIALVEWADRVAHLLPAERVEVEFSIKGDTSRRITIRGTTPKNEAIVDELASAVGSK
jgi:tRNA threonylcarbamoyladenosine biosynthesis protein TsaE